MALAAAQEKPKLYVIRGSHACRSAMLLLEHKRIAYKTVRFPAGLHPLGLRLAGFSGNPSAFRKIDGRSHRVIALSDRLGTVPALRFGEARVKTNRQIARFLEQTHPEPPLFPADQPRREQVEQAERWADEVLQMAARRLILRAAIAGRVHDGGDQGRLGPLLFAHRSTRLAASRVFAMSFGATRATEAELLEGAPAMLDQIDDWIGQGVVGGEQPNAADCAIAPSVALLDYHVELREEIGRRPVGRMLDRLLPAPVR